MRTPLTGPLVFQEFVTVVTMIVGTRVCKINSVCLIERNNHIWYPCIKKGYLTQGQLRGKPVTIQARNFADLQNFLYTELRCACVLTEIILLRSRVSIVWVV